MNPSRFPFQRTATVAALAVLLSACSVLEEDKVNYKSAAKAPTLEVPPDLTQLRKDSRYAIESTSATASGFQNAASKVTDAGTAANVLGNVKLERQGQQRWLVAAMPADKAWESLREFWASNGFVLVTDTPEVGIMETEWAENRAKLPQDFVRKTLGKVLDSLYSTGERDKFRTRVERNAQGGVEIYITHRGMVENYADAQKERTIWQPRPSDPELEIEFLRRLMITLGSSPEAAKTAAGSATAAVLPSAQVTRLDGQPTIVLNDSLDRAWRRTGVALDRSGFTVEDRDRTSGIYFVRYVAPGTTVQEPGFFSRLFSSKKDTPSALVKYRISLTAVTEAQVKLRVLNANGQAEQSADAERILKLIAAELR
ncbi:outer membrane protein assembly factor BamC [Limnohabitans sp. 2KL-1]|uniref:outer membrane protein assembly factor BamC n=1 Tax=Limnohabitans sp. 2KL-1 TaxID=1100699 RepID=UPI001E5EFEDF|nr:outer membrane protein assembly factor BamC [Limnohabitans sp. 2KL-1]